MTVPDFEGLTTPRLLIRRLREDDAANLSAYRSDPAVARFQGRGEVFPEARSRELIREMRDRAPGQEGWFQCAVADRETGELLGDLSLHGAEVRHGEIGFTFARFAQGRGLAREAVAARWRRRWISPSAR